MGEQSPTKTYFTSDVQIVIVTDYISVGRKWRTDACSEGIEGPTSRAKLKGLSICSQREHRLLMTETAAGCARMGRGKGETVERAGLTVARY